MKCFPHCERGAIVDIRGSPAAVPFTVCKERACRLGKVGGGLMPCPRLQVAAGWQGVEGTWQGEVGDFNIRHHVI